MVFSPIMDKIKVGGVILAAGLSRRFGAEKLLARVGGRPLGRLALEAALASRLAKVILVTRPELAQELIPIQMTDPHKLKVVLNHRPEEGQARSLRLGLEPLEEEISHGLILLADQPMIRTGLVDRFVALAEEGVELAALHRTGTMLPPTLFGRLYFKELGLLGGDEGGRSVLALNRERVVLVEPEDELAPLDVDRPRDLKLIERGLER